MCTVWWLWQIYEILVVLGKNMQIKLVKFILGSDVFYNTKSAKEKTCYICICSGLNFMSFNIVMGWIVSPEKDKYLSPNP